MERRPQDNVRHSGIQPHSMGELFPAIIGRMERYCAPVVQCHCPEVACQRAKACAHPSVSWELIIGAFVEEYASREDAEKVARYVCQGGRIIPEHYAELMSDGNVAIRAAMAPDANRVRDALNGRRA